MKAPVRPAAETGVAPRSWFKFVRTVLPPRRIKQIATTVLDQGAVSAGTFLLNVLLARQISPTDYGVFVLSYSIINFSVDLQNALVLEPMMVFGPGKPEEQRTRYLGSVLTMQVAFTAFLMMAVWLAVAGWRVARGEGAALGTIAMMAFGMLGVHTREFARKVFFTAMEPARALRNDSLYLSLLITVLLMTVVQGWLSAAAAFATIGLTGLVTAIVGVHAAGVTPVISRSWLRAAVREHWEYGKWMIGVSGARWAGNELYFFVAAAFLGPAGSAALKAVQNIYAPVSLFLSGLANLFLPIASGLAGRATVKSLNRFVILTGACLAPGVLAYAIVVTVGSHSVFRILYHGKYAEYASLVPLVGVGYILSAAFQGPSLGLRALAKPRAIFLITMLGAAVTTLAVVPLTIRWALAGSVIAVLLSYVVGSPLWAIQYVKAARARVATPGSRFGTQDEQP